MTLISTYYFYPLLKKRTCRQTAWFVGQLQPHRQPRIEASELIIVYSAPKLYCSAVHTRKVWIAEQCTVRHRLNNNKPRQDIIFGPREALNCWISQQCYHIESYRGSTLLSYSSMISYMISLPKHVVINVSVDATISKLEKF